MSEEFVRIPLRRIAALIGPGGRAKRAIEEKTASEINVDSSSGEVEILYEGSDEENFFMACRIVKAVGRGFSPESAMKLLEPDTTIKIIDLPEFVGKSGKALLSKKGRVIGRRGAAREAIEEETNTLISVFGKTVSIIGTPESIAKAEKAVEMLLGGAEHKTVYGYLKKGEREEFEL